MERVAAGECYLALGSNLGDRRGHLAAAVDALNDHPSIELRSRSSLFETVPVGGSPGQGPYLNAAVQLRTSLMPVELLNVCQRIERRLGRQRTVPNASRTIDLDLLLYGQQVCDTTDLTLPHPRMHLRRFVLIPLAEIAPDALHPVLQRSISQLLAELPPADVTGQHCRRLADQDWNRAPVPGRLPPA